ncbi:MAG: glycyl-radical enzyme activating protein [Promethearchaeota archaeon]
MKAKIVEIKRNSLDDGPGIRTVIFFKGCPLSCVWCQNPETKSSSQEITFISKNCRNLKKCIDACEVNAISFLNKFRINRDICNLCGKCIEACDNGSLKFVSVEYEFNELVEIILKDKSFYDNSGGGITLSGGEPTLQMEFLSEFLKEIKNNEIHVCLETCGYYNQNNFNKLILPYIDLIYFDLKIYDSNSHEKYCNVPNKIIFNNFEDLVKRNDIRFLTRIPLIPKITTTKKNLKDLVDYLRSNDIKEVALLPYNPLWLSKLDSLGIKKEYFHSNWLSKKEKDNIKKLFTDFEFRDF